jgi:hypothetical protein
MSIPASFVSGPSPEAWALIAPAAGAVLHMELVGRSPTVDATGLGELLGKSNCRRDRGPATRRNGRDCDIPSQTGRTEGMG